MKIIVTESQFKIINEAAIKNQNLCATFGHNTPFCNKLEKIVKDGKRGGRDGNLAKLTANFFNKVVTNPQYFHIIPLIPGNKEYESRMEDLVKFKDVLKQHDSCPEIYSELIKDIEDLPEKGIPMVVDDKNQYSLLNRLNTHYTAKSYLLTQIILNEAKEVKTNLNELSDEEIRKLIKHVINDKYINNVSKSLFDLLENNKEFRDYFFGTLEYSRNKGNKTESYVFNSLREKYGVDNVIEFSRDFGFVDDFGVDGVLIINDTAHPIQISTSNKNPKIFKYASQSCKPLGFYMRGSGITIYHPF